MLRVLDPTYEERPAPAVLAVRPASLRGATVGFISNGKAGTQEFFDHLQRLLVSEWGVASVVRRTKGNYSAPAEADLMDEATRWAAVFTGVGD